MMGNLILGTINLLAGFAGLILGGYPLLSGLNFGVAFCCFALAIRDGQ